MISNMTMLIIFLHGISWRAQTAFFREIYKWFKALDLSTVDSIMAPMYSVLGPKPRQPSCMLRSLLLIISTKTVSIPLWVSSLHTFCCTFFYFCRFFFVPPLLFRSFLYFAMPVKTFFHLSTTRTCFP